MNMFLSGERVIYAGYHYFDDLRTFLPPAIISIAVGKTATAFALRTAVIS